MPPVERVIEEIVSQLPGYEPRPQQLEMARTITRAIESKRHALIEAGTGSGKSFGYLIPMLESGKTAVISTGTIALQEQLLNKDIPFLAQAYGREIKVALAKGRSNYICLRKLDDLHRTLSPADADRATVENLLQISTGKVWNGDRAALPFNVENRLWRDSLASDSYDCLGPKCPNFQFTPHRMARLACENAQIIIANHALYLTDLAMGGAVLPKHEIAIFDEAHHLDRVAVDALSIEVNRWETTRLLQRVQRRFSQLPSAVVQAIHDAESEVLDLVFRRGRGQFRIDPEPELEAKEHRLAEAVGRLAQWLESTDPMQMTLMDADPGTQRARAEILREQMQSVASNLAARWDHFSALPSGGGRANWMSIDPSRDFFEMQSAPLDVGETLHELLWSKTTCVLTSATLAVDGQFDFLKRELGLPANTLDAVLGSPFDYPNQALLYVPRGVPMPSEATFIEAACGEIERILHMTQGRAFVLCTSYRSLREISASLIHKLPFPCKTQEELPRSRLIDWFKNTPNAVLFATATFWEGVDIPGDALSCVIIDKLPFASPEDPVVQARTERMKTRNEDWFGGYMLPKAVLALKQGFGRLIRTRTDTGIVALLDRRVLTHRYGEVVLRSLPPARRIQQLAPTLKEAFNRSATGERAPASGDGFGPQPPGAASGRWNAPPPDLDAVLGEPRD